MRVYIPTTLPGLAEALKAGELGPAPLDAFAVTPALREWYVSDDIEELEYAALTRAAQASLRQLALRPDAPRRRVVVAVDVADSAAAVHADADDAQADIATAADALGAADAGDDDARFVVDGAEDHELLWYATQEIQGLLE
jgi:hypothetical protein